MFYLQADDQNGNENVDDHVTSPEPNRKKLKQDPKLQMLKEAFGILKNTANKPHDTELRSFFDFIQEKMKNYTKDTKNAIQHEIFQIIMRADQGYYNSIQNYGYYSTTQHQQAPRRATSSNVTNQEAPFSDVNIALPSTSSSANQQASSANHQQAYSANQQASSPPAPYSPYSNSSDYSSDMNFEDYV